MKRKPKPSEKVKPASVRITRKFITMTPEQRERWRRQVEAIEQEKPELTRLALDRKAEVDTLQVVAADLQSARKAAGITLEALQLATGIDRAQLSRLLQSKGNPTLATLQRVAEACGRRIVIRCEVAQ